MKEWMKPMIEELEVKDTKGGSINGKGEESNYNTYISDGLAS